MTVDEIKTEIRALPDKEVGPLGEWLREYNDGEVWDRQIKADVERLGEEEFARRLSQGMAQADERPKALLRILNRLCPTRESVTDELMHDLSVLLGAPLQVQLLSMDKLPDCLKNQKQ